MSRIRIADLITPERIIPRLHATNKHQVIEKLSRLVAVATGLNKEPVRRAVLDREDLTTFGVGHGIAIPHAAVRGLSDPVGAFACVARPIDFGAADGRLADVVLLLPVPEMQAGILSSVLACVARRLRDREIVRCLRIETSAEVAQVILTTDSWRGPGPHPDWKHAA